MKKRNFTSRSLTINFLELDIARNKESLQRIKNTIRQATAKRRRLELLINGEKIKLKRLTRGKK